MVTLEVGWHLQEFSVSVAPQLAPLSRNDTWCLSVISLYPHENHDLDDQILISSFKQLMKLRPQNILETCQRSYHQTRTQAICPFSPLLVFGRKQSLTVIIPSHRCLLPPSVPSPLPEPPRLSSWAVVFTHYKKQTQKSYTLRIRNEERGDFQTADLWIPLLKILIQ